MPEGKKCGDGVEDVEDTNEMLKQAPSLGEPEAHAPADDADRKSVV